MHNKKLYGTATVGTKGQIVIPADAREELGIKTGDRLYVVNAMNSAGIVFLKEECLESMVEQLSAQVDSFRALKNEEKKSN
jgi:AbrB family looped-hinge helix DNA binding protein